MYVLPCVVSSRPQSPCAHSALPCRHQLNRATALSEGSQPSSRRLFSLTLFATLATLCLFVLAGVKLQAQTAHVGKLVTLGSGFANPFTVAVDASGNVAVIDYGNHAVKEIMAAGGYTTVRTLVGGLSFMFGSAFDSHGNLFFTEYGKNHVEEMLAVNGVIPPSPKIVIIGSGFNIPAGVAVDANDNVFVGDQNNNVVKEILASSGYATTITIATGFSTPDGVAVDQYGNVFVANDGANLVQEIEAVNGVIPPSPTIRTLGSGFSQPFDVAVDGGGNVYVADRGNNSIKEMMAVNGVVPVSPVINNLDSGSFATPTGVAVDASGNVFVADNGNSAVKEIQRSGVNFGQIPLGTTSAIVPVAFTFDIGGTLGSTFVLTLGDGSKDFKDAGGGTCVANTVYSAGQTCTVNVKFGPLAPGPRNGAVNLLTTGGALITSGPLRGIGGGPQATFANTTSGVSLPSSTTIAGSGFNGPAGAAVDASGNIFISDGFNGAIKEILASGGWTTVNQLSSFQFDYPNGVALDGAGNVYVADTLNDAVEEIMATGGYTTVNTIGSGFTDPYAVAVDGSGNVFVANYSPGTVQEMMSLGGTIPASPYIRTLASGINGPDGLAVDSNGNVFVADYGDGTVLEIHAVNGTVPASPVITTIASGLSGPSNISVDGAGNVFVADTDAGTVVELVAAGGFSSSMVVGSGFTAPEATAVLGNGNVIVADAASNQVKILDYADAPTLTFASTVVGSTSSDSPQTVTVSNDGNLPLTFPLPNSGTNPSIPANFTWDNSSTCVQSTPSSPQTFAIGGGASCTMAFNFKPTAAGSFSSAAVLTDNNLNLNNTTQSIQLNGTGTVTPPALTSPSASPISGSTQFKWSPGAGSTGFILRVGTGGGGSSDIYYSGVLANTVTSATTSIPSQGVTVFVRLYYQVGATWPFIDYTFTESGTSSPPALTSPTASPLSGSTNFVWNPGVGSYQFRLLIGTGGAGTSDIFSSPVYANTVTSQQVTIPSNGVTLYVRLRYLLNGVWNNIDYTFTEAAKAPPPSPALTSPSVSPLSGSTKFTWSPGTGTSGFVLRIGTAGAGMSDIFFSGTLANTVTSQTVNIPADGVEIFVRLYYLINGTWNYKDYTFTESGTASPPSLTSPAASPISGSTNFIWNPGKGSGEFELRVGTGGPGTSDLYYGVLANTVTSEAVNIPSKGGTVYVRLYYVMSGTWSYKDYTFTEAP